MIKNDRTFVKPSLQWYEGCILCILVMVYVPSKLIDISCSIYSLVLIYEEISPPYSVPLYTPIYKCMISNKCLYVLELSYQSLKISRSFMSHGVFYENSERNHALSLDLNFNMMRLWLDLCQILGALETSLGRV